MLVKAMSPSGEVTPTKGSPFQSCQAQNAPLGVLNPSGWVPAGEMMSYWASRLAAAVVLPKWAAALTASVPSWKGVAWAGDAALSSTQTPASTPPEYWVMTPDHSSPFVPSPLNSSCR